jgi:hypothetical protein
MLLNALVEPIGVMLRTIRRQRQLSLREVEERSIRFSQEWGKRASDLCWLAPAAGTWKTRTKCQQN